jgi:glycine/D-amino acid oxidase-like deaminating enzyme
VSVAAGVPYWLDEPYEPRPALAERVEAEACVIGAGVAGLSCALALARAGVDTVVLERDTVAGGASGRNGGFLLAGVAPFYTEARELYGRERARRMYAATLGAQRDMYGLAEELGAGDSVRQVGLLRASASAEEAEDVARQVEALGEDGFPAVPLERDELPAAVARFALNGCLIAHDGSLQPARWIRTLARGAEAAGARIHDGSAVEGPVRAPAEGGVRTTAGATVAARHVVVAADGALPALVPEYSPRVQARRLHMTATAPLPERVTDHLVYYRWGHEYFQQRPDGRLLIGGFSDLDGDSSYTDSAEGSPAIWGRIEQHIREDLGLDDAVITHRWAGVVGYSDDRLPYVGEVPGRPGLWVAGGYSGHGNVPGFLAGRQIAEAISGTGDGAPPLFPADR